MDKIEEIAKKLEAAGFALDTANRLFNQLYMENREKGLSHGDHLAWNAAVKAYDELCNARSWLEEHNRII